MKILLHPKENEFAEALLRPEQLNRNISREVRDILDRVKFDGDRALFSLTKQFDKAELSELLVSEFEFREAEKKVPDSLKNAIQTAAKNIDCFHRQQLQSPEISIETMPGIRCFRKEVPIEQVGFYIPGGSAPLFSTLLMLGIPARLAGVQNITLTTPPNDRGKIHPAILWTAEFLGVRNVFKVGGAQAIGALAYGTESVPRVYKIFGPGNSYVDAAKRLVSEEGVAIDLPAGPSEVLVIADNTAEPRFVAADLLSQAEHGPDSQVVLITTDKRILDETMKEMAGQLETLPRKQVAETALKNSVAILAVDVEAAMSISNYYAPEHLILAVNEPLNFVPLITNAASVFLGSFSPESVGDYASGTNHVLPTGAAARSFSGVCVNSFLKKITFQELTREGLSSLSETVIEMAEAEGLVAHANAVRIRVGA